MVALTEVRLCVLVFKNRLALRALEIEIVKSFHYKLVHLGRSGRLATGWACLVLLRPISQTGATVEIVTCWTLFGVSSYQ